MKDFAPNTTKVEICVHSLNVGMEKELSCLEADCSEGFGVRRRDQVTRARLCRLSTLLLVLLYSLLPGIVVSQGILYPVVYYYRPAKYTGANLAKIEVLSFSTTYHAPSNAFIYPGISYSSTDPAEIRAIRSDGTVAGIQPNQALYSTNGVMVGTSSDMFIAGLNNGIFVTRILNGGSQASFFSSVGLYLPGHNMGLGYSLNDGTSAIVYVGSRNGGVVRAFDASASCSKILESRMILSLASSQIAEFLDGNSILITTQLTSIFAVMRKSDLILTSNIATLLYSNKANTFKVDPLSSARTIVATMSIFGSFKLEEVNFIGVAPSLVRSLALTAQANSIAFLRNMDFILLGVEAEVLRLIRRSNIQDTTLPTLNIPLRSSRDSISCCEVANTKSIFSLVGGGEAYYYYFEETYCLNPLSVPCDQCQIGYYLTDQYYCLDPPNFPIAMGISGIYMKPCKDPNCKSCINNVNVCNVCDTANYWYLFGSVCVKNVDIKPTYGANLLTGVVVSCADVNCKDCRIDHTICVWCNDDYSLSAPAPAGLCLFNTGLPSTFGPNPATGVMTTCQTSNCDKCKRIYTECDFCLLSFSIFSTTYCIPNTLIEDLRGPHLTTGGIAACTVSNCNKCKSDHTICDFCLNNFALENNQCTNFTLIVDNRGPNLASGRIDNCAVSNCRKCKTDHLKCDTCHDAWGLQANTCLLVETLPSNSGINLSNGWVQFCTDPGCKDCRFNKEVCVACLQDYYFDENKTCVYVQHIHDRQGANLATQYIDRCQVGNCLYCKADNTKCFGCIDKYELNTSGECERLTYRMQVNLDNNNLYPHYGGSDLSMFVTFNDSKLAVFGDYFTQLITMKDQVFHYELVEEQSGNLVAGWSPTTRLGAPWENNTLILELFNKAILPGSKYIVRVFNSQVLKFERDEYIFGFDKFSFNFTLESNQPIDRIQTLASLGTFARFATIDPGAKAYLLNIFQIVKYVLVYFDPSGFVARYFHYCQRVQRFSQFNVNFGPGVSSFLTNLNEYESVMANQTLTLKGMQLMRGSQGKSAYIETDFFVVTFPKVLVYLFLWTLRVVIEFLRHSFDVFPDWFYKILFHLQKAHFCFVALCFMDFIGFSFRVVISGADWLQLSLAYLVIMALSWDLVEAAYTVCQPWRWLKRIREIEALEQQNLVFANRLEAEAEELEFVDKRSEKAHISEEKLATLKKLDLIHNKDTKHRYVNNFDTQENLDINLSCLIYLDGPLKTTREVALSSAARANEAIHVSRMVGFTLITYLAPYATQPGIIALIGLEGAVIIYISAVYIIKKGHLKNPVLLVVEICRSVLMGLFLLVTYQIRDRVRSEPYDPVADSRGSTILLAMMVLEVANMLFQVVYYWRKRRPEPPMQVSYDKYLWKKGDNFIGDELQPEEQVPVVPEPPKIYLDQKNHDGLCISIDTVAVLKSRALKLQKEAERLSKIINIDQPKTVTKNNSSTVQEAIHLGLTAGELEPQRRVNTVNRKKPRRKLQHPIPGIDLKHVPRSQFEK